MTSEAEQAYTEILERIAPEALEAWRQKTLDYRGGPGFLVLGARGQFSDITRKWLKLYQWAWEGTELVGEQPREIVQDFIGHCLLMLYLIEHPERDGVRLQQVAGEVVACTICGHTLDVHVCENQNVDGVSYHGDDYCVSCREAYRHHEFDGDCEVTN